MGEIREAQVLSRLQLLCARRECCESQIREKALKALEGDSEAAERLLALLKEEGYVDDFRYAEAYAREKANISGWGPVKIRHALMAKKIGSDAISSALGEASGEAASLKMEKVIRAKWAALSRKASSSPGRDSFSLRNSLLRFALSRGYSYDQAIDVVDNVMSEEN